MPYTFDDAVHVLGLEPEDFDYSHPDDDSPPAVNPADFSAQFSLTVTWDGDPELAPWYAESLSGIVRHTFPAGTTVTFRDAVQ